MHADVQCWLSCSELELVLGSLERKGREKKEKMGCDSWMCILVKPHRPLQLPDIMLAG